MDIDGNEFGGGNMLLKSNNYYKLLIRIPQAISTKWIVESQMSSIQDSINRISIHYNIDNYRINYDKNKKLLTLYLKAGNNLNLNINDFMDDFILYFNPGGYWLENKPKLISVDEISKYSYNQVQDKSGEYTYTEIFKDGFSSVKELLILLIVVLILSTVSDFF